MKLSECIILGSVGTEQAFHTLKDPRGRTCAMGAAMVGAGMGDEYDMVAMFPILYQHVAAPGGLPWPTTGPDAAYVQDRQNQILWNAIVILNNNYRWTRPQIAAWVATIEALEVNEGSPCNIQEEMSWK